MMQKRLNVILKEHVNLTEKVEWNATLYESCFCIQLEANRVEDGKCKVVLQCHPDEDNGYKLLIDYQLQVNDVKEFIEGDIWDVGGELLTLESNDIEFDVTFAILVSKILVAEDLTIPTSFRNFHVLNFESSFYVNTAQLNLLGGKLFKEWYDGECQGERSAVVQKMDPTELNTLLNACCAFSTPVIHRRNFYSILEIARMWNINGLLRKVETFLIESTTIHKIRKLEFSVEYRMARLADYVLRSFSSKIKRMECLFNYLSENNETLNDVHSDILKMLEISPDYIVL